MKQDCPFRSLTIFHCILFMTKDKQQQSIKSSRVFEKPSKWLANLSQDVPKYSQAPWKLYSHM